MKNRLVACVKSGGIFLLSVLCADIFCVCDPLCKSQYLVMHFVFRYPPECEARTSNVFGTSTSCFDMLGV